MSKLLLAAGLILLVWWFFKKQRSFAPPMPEGEARALLGVPADADVEAVREAHRRLIAKVHPDAGGSPELARKVNQARDILIASINRHPPKAS